MSSRIAGDKASYVLRRMKVVAAADKVKASEADAESERRATKAKRWVSNLYVNNSDYICCYYGVAVSTPGLDTSKDCEGNAVVRLFVASKGP
ncbi:hypothetical protein Cni_G19149 [Canna indica]|uniref:Uncharacterized protein n=1 Tax=Canna indica TaxID=4628 RepID=A0AAQ3QGP1_9LILI|nr:hypothetical protein Cni_G19149 [Canna indica]